MNHLRELLEFKASTVRLQDGIEPDVASEAFSTFKRLGTQAVCFSLGDVTESAAGDPVIHDLAKLPYETCWFEMSQDGPLGLQFVGCFAFNSKDAAGQPAVRCFYFVRTRGEWCLALVSTSQEFARGRLCLWPQSAEATEMKRAWGSLVGAFLTAMNCKNVATVLHQPDQKLQAARARKGKQPLFSFWTLQLNGRTDKGQPQGGTHSSPRVHLRRGHPREFKPGQFTWVQQAVVGNASAGMVHKDYAAGTSLRKSPAQPD